MTNCCNTERVFKLPSTPAQVQNGTGFVPGYTIAALGGPVPTPAGQGTSSAGEGTTSTPVAGASGASIANSPTSQPATSQSNNVVVIVLGAVSGVALLLLLPITLFLLSREKRRNKNLRAGQWNGSKRSTAVRHRARFGNSAVYVMIQEKDWSWKQRICVSWRRRDSGSYMSRSPQRLVHHWAREWCKG